MAVVRRVYSGWFEIRARDARARLLNPSVSARLYFQMVDDTARH